MYQLVLILNALVVPCQDTTAIYPAFPTFPRADFYIRQGCMGVLEARSIPLATFPTYQECMKRVAAIGETRRERGICREVE